jgi:hypothetical protein
MPFHHVSGIFEIDRFGAGQIDERFENYEIKRDEVEKRDFSKNRGSSNQANALKQSSRSNRKNAGQAPSHPPFSWQPHVSFLRFYPANIVSVCDLFDYRKP